MEKLIKRNSEVEIIGTDCGGGSIVHYKGKPYTGLVHFYWANEHKLEAIIEYVDGYEEGLQQTFHPNGQLEHEFLLKFNDVVAGTYKEYDKDGNILVDETKEIDI